MASNFWFGVLLFALCLGFGLQHWLLLRMFQQIASDLINEEIPLPPEDASQDERGS